MSLRLRLLLLLGCSVRTLAFISSSRGGPRHRHNGSSESSSSSRVGSSSRVAAGANTIGDPASSSSRSFDELQDDLLSACQRNEPGQVAMLLDAGAKLGGLRSVFGVSPLHIAALEDSPELAKAVLKRSTQEDLDYMMRIKRSKETLDAVWLSRYDGGRMTPLFLALMKGHLEVALLLIEAGCKVDLGYYRDYEGIVPAGYYTSPLVALSRNPEIDANRKTDLAAARLLLENGADPNLHDDLHQQTPLSEAIEESRLDMVDLLLSHNADPKLGFGRSGKSPLALARESGEVDIVRSLLKAFDKASSDASAAAAPAKKAAAANNKAGGVSLELRVTPENVLVTGPGTYRAKPLLTQTGGKWSKQLQAWTFAVGAEKTLEKVLRNSTNPCIDLVVHSNGDYDRKAVLAAEKVAALEAARTSNAAATVEIKAHKKAALVLGDTKQVSSTLKALGGSWNKTLGGWIFPRKTCSELIVELRRDTTNTVTVAAELVTSSSTTTAPTSSDGPETVAPTGPLWRKGQ